MADDANAVANGTVETPVQPAGQTPDDSQQLVQRLRQQVAGGQAFYQAGSKYGIKKPEDLERLGRVYQAITNAGLDPDTVVQSLSAPAPSHVAPQHINAPAFDASAVVQGVVGVLDEREAYKQHVTALGSEKALIENAVSSVKDLTARERVAVAKAVRAAIEDSREDYPDKHPLYGKVLKPVDDTFVQRALKATLDEMNAEAGKDLAGKADAALASLGRKPTAGTPGGLATPAAANSAPRRPFNPLNASDAEKQTWLAEELAKLKR